MATFYIICYLLEAAYIVGLVFWHKAAPSRHLIMMIAGLAWVVTLGLPQLFVILHGHEILHDSMGEERAEYLISYSDIFQWIGWAFFALGLWRISKDSQLDPSSPE